jgi:hypothetical protein
MEDQLDIIPLRRGPLTADCEVRSSPHRALRYNPGLPVTFVDALWNHPEEVFAAGKLLRATGTRAAALVQCDSRLYVIKHYYLRSWRHVINQAVAGPEALRAYELGCLLADAGIRTPRPIAWVGNRQRGRYRDCYLLYPYVQGRMLRTLINQGLMSQAEMDHAKSQLYEIWKLLSTLKVGLKDANSGNFIVAPNGLVWLIDLDGSTIHSNPLVADFRLQIKWHQVHRSMRRAERDWNRGRIPKSLRRAA